MMPWSKAINHRVLARKWFYGLMTRPNMRIKVRRKLHDIRILDWALDVRGDIRLAPTEAERRPWECIARNNPDGIF